MLNRILNRKQYGFALIILGSLVLALALFLEFSLGVELAFDWLIVPFLFIIITILILIILIYSYTLYSLRTQMKNFDERGKNIPYLDLTENDLPFPQKFDAHLAKIETLRFKQFATIDASDKHNGSRILWYWVDESHTVRLSMSLVQPLNQIYISFITVLEDEAVIETGYRTRMQMDTDRLHIRNVSTNLEATHDYHLHQIATYEAVHGAAIAIHRSAELIEWSNRLKKRNHPLIYQNRIEKYSQYLIIYAVLATAFIVAFLLSSFVNLIFSVAVITILIGIASSYFEVEELIAAFGSVKQGKKKKNS